MIYLYMLNYIHVYLRVMINGFKHIRIWRQNNVVFKYLIIILTCTFWYTRLNLDKKYRDVKLNFLHIIIFLVKKIHFLYSIFLFKRNTHNSRIQQNMTIIHYYVMISNHKYRFR